MSSLTNVHDIEIEIILLGQRARKFSQILYIIRESSNNVKTAKISQSSFRTLYLCRSLKLLSFICKTQFGLHVNRC